jgi:hypothetical protein
MRFTNEQLEKMTTEERFKSLSSREQLYFNIMKAKAGVLYITSKPGLAKSSIARNIARLMGYNYMDIRLAMVDETDVGLFPNVQMVVEDADGNIVATDTMTAESFKVLDFVVPKWAVIANQKPTVIHFEELNRASLSVRNAALQLLLDREIGTEFKFNENVLMLASGNLGEEDGTDVEEFDSALNNRLIHIKHDLVYSEWIENYAKYNVHPLIVSFINNQPECFYRTGGSDNDSNQEVKAYATPRSWTFLSEYILETLGNREGQMNGEFEVKDVSKLVTQVGSYYVGSTFHKFAKYLDASMKFSVKDVLNNFKKVKPMIEKTNRDRKSEIILQLKEHDLKKLSDPQVENLIQFLDMLDADELMGFLTDVIDNGAENEVNKEPMKTILKSFEDKLRKISSMS